MKEIVLEKKNDFSVREYCCDITRFLDEQCELCNLPYKIKSYIYDSRYIYDHKTIVICIPGRIIGAIYVDYDCKIVGIEIDNTLIEEDEWYKANTNNELEKFVGMKVLFPVE